MMVQSEFDYYEVQREWIEFRKRQVRLPVLLFTVQSILVRCAYGCLMLMALYLWTLILQVIEAPFSWSAQAGMVTAFLLTCAFCLVRHLGKVDALENELLAVARKRFLEDRPQYRAIDWVTEMINRRYL